MGFSKESVERVLAYQPYFDDEAVDKCMVSDSALAGPYVYADRVKEFVRTLEEEGFLPDFDWRGWGGEAIRYFTERELLATADVETVSKLFTVIVKAEIETQGILAEMINKGVIAELLQRLRQIGGM